MKRINGIIGSSLAVFAAHRAMFQNSDYEGTNKIQSGIVFSVCFVFLLMLFVNTPLVHAESAGPSDRAEVADPTSGHPCIIAVNLRRYYDYLKKIDEGLMEQRLECSARWSEQNDRVRELWPQVRELDDQVEEMNNQVEEMNNAIEALKADIYDEFISSLPSIHLRNPETVSEQEFVDSLEEHLDCYRRYLGVMTTEEEVERIEERLNELRSAIEARDAALEDYIAALEDYIAAFEARDAAILERDRINSECEKIRDRWHDAYWDHSMPALRSYLDAQRECNFTRDFISVADRLRDSQMENQTSMFDSSLLDEMLNPMGSDNQQPRSQSDPVFPFVLPNDTSQPTMSGETATPETDVTAQTMQVQEPETEDPEVDQRVWTHRPVPLNTSPSRVAVPSAPPQNTTPPKSLIGVPLLPRTK
jgi:phage shock protein A